MNCQDFKHNLNDALDDTLSNELQVSFDDHLTECAACKEEYRLMRELLQDAEQLDISILPERDLWPEIEKQIVSALKSDD